MDSKYEKMIRSIATELVEEIEIDTLYAAFLAQRCPVEDWIDNITLDMVDVFKDILQDMNVTEEESFWSRFAFWRKNNSGGY